MGGAQSYTPYLGLSQECGSQHPEEDHANKGNRMQESLERGKEVDYLTAISGVKEGWVRYYLD